MKIFESIEKFLGGPLAKLATNRYITALRDGMVSTIPLTIVGSLFLIIAFPPVPQSWKESMEFFKWINLNVGSILLPFRLSMGLIGVFAIYNTGYSLGKIYKLDGVSCGTLSLLGYFLTIIPKMATTVGANPESLGFVIPMQYLGAQGLFTGFIISFYAVEVLRFFKERGIEIKMPEGVPESVAKSFSALFPTIFLVVTVSIVTIFLKIDLHALVYSLFKPLSVFFNGPLGTVLIVFLICLLWSAGLHGVSVIGSLARPIWLELLDQNSKALAEGAKILPNIAPEPFYQWFIWIGGSGATLGLVFLMVFKSKSSHLKALGKTAFLPGIFNINEPIIFGMPVMLNPYMIIPFILGPIIVAITSYVAMAMNLVARPSILAPWTFPAPIGAFLSTNGDWRAIVLVFINIFLTTIVYYPFFKAYDKKLLGEEIMESLEKK